MLVAELDLLLESGDSVDEVAAVLLEELQAIDGVASTVTWFAAKSFTPADDAARLSGARGCARNAAPLR